MFCKTNTRFYTQECKVGCFLYYLGKTPSEKSLDFCNILHGFVSKWKKNKIMKNLICKVGLLCVVLLGIIDTGFAQSFSVQRVGNGKQAIILIPGFACSGEVWEQTVDSLQNNYSCYILTMPGFAGIPPEKNPSFDSWAKQIIGFIQKENIKNPILIGHSMGGGLALYIASSQPNLVKGIVVVDALPCLAALYNPDFQSKKIAPEEFNEFESQMRKIDEEQFYRQAYISATSLTSDSLRYDNLVKWSLSTDRTTYAHMYYEYSNIDLRPIIPSISVSTLVLLEYPFKKIAPMIEQQFGNLPNIRLEYANKGLHFIMFDDWEWYIQQIMDFLNDRP